MKIVWLGHACFAVESAGFRLILDPFSGVPGLPDVCTEADAVLASHDHFDHHYFDGVTLRTGREMPFSIERIGTFHDDQNGALRGGNTIHILRAEGLTAVHLGDLGHGLTTEQAAPLYRCDVLMIPVGGTYTINGAQAAEVVEQLKPRIVLPMHYRRDRFGFDEIAGVQPFLHCFPEDTVHRYAGNTLEITSDMPRQIAILNPLD